MDKSVFSLNSVISGRKIYVGENALSSLPSYLTDGATGIIYDDGTKEIADEVARAFRPFSRKVFATKNPDEIPEYARVILGVGTGSVANETKRIAKRLGVPSALLFTAPTTDTVLAGEGIDQVFLDEKILRECPRECIAAGWGIVLSEDLGRFEDYFNRTVLDKPTACGKKKDIPSDADATALALYLLELSAERISDDNSAVMAKFLYDVALKQGVRRRLMGEYKFVSANVLYSFYSGFLSSPSIDCMLPPDHDSKIDEISRLTGRSRERLLKMFDFSGSGDYFRINYILSEYRLDLLDRLKAVDLRPADKKWRRLYADAGYWLKSTFTTHSLLKALRLSCEIGNGLLRYIGETGYADCAYAPCDIV